VARSDAALHDKTGQPFPIGNSTNQPINFFQVLSGMQLATGKVLHPKHRLPRIPTPRAEPGEGVPFYRSIVRGCDQG